MKAILDIEPSVFGSGIRLFNDANFESKLKLVNVKKLPLGIVQLNYKVVKKV